MKKQTRYLVIALALLNIGELFAQTGHDGGTYLDDGPLRFGDSSGAWWSIPLKIIAMLAFLAIVSYFNNKAEKAKKK